MLYRLFYYEKSNFYHVYLKISKITLQHYDNKVVKCTCYFLNRQPSNIYRANFKLTLIMRAVAI